MRLSGALNVFSGMIARASNQLSTVVVTLVATRFLSPAEFGVFALASIAVTFIRTLLHLGPFEFLLKSPNARNCSSECLAVNVVLSVALSSILAGGVLGTQAIAGASPVTMVMLLLLPSNLISAIGAWREALVLRSGRLTLYYTLTMITEITAAGVAVVLLYMGLKVYALVWQVYCRNLMLLILYLNVGKTSLSRRFSFPQLQRIMHWSSSRYASSLLSFTASYGPDLFLGVFLSPAATGLYRASSRLITAVSDMFSQPIKLIAMTTFSERVAKGQSSTKIWPAMAGLVAIGGWSALAGLAVVAHQLVPLALGEHWRAAAGLIPLLAVARAAALIDSVTGSLLVAYDHQHALFRIQTIVSLIGTALLVCCAPFGLVPATLAVAAGALLSTAALARLCFRCFEGSGAEFLRLLPMVLGPVAATSIGALLSQYIAEESGLPPLLELASACGLGFMAWAIALILLRVPIRSLANLLQSGLAKPE